MLISMDNFEQHLMQKYPELFYEKQNGELECPCGVWVPQGWEKIVDDLCCTINDYIKCTYRQGQEILSKKYYLWYIPHFLLIRIHYRVIKFFPKLNNYESNKPFYNFLQKLYSNALKHSKWIKIHPPEVKIDQIKEKFGGLRFYYSGGNEQISGMVYMAEHLCSKTCEVSGEEGSLCSRGGWVKTLSSDILEQQPYSGYKPVK